MEKITATLKEVLYGVIPILLLITLLQFTIARLPWEFYFNFLGGTVLLTVGLTMFLIGLEIGFIPFGESFGASLVKGGKMRTILLFGFIIGLVVTLPEPDVQVLAAQADAYLENIDKPVLILGIAVGVGIFVALALFRIFTGISVKYILTGATF
ncbi:DUF1538 family protein [Brucepastera parasyntrophica]|uniref:DUF1538 family protein n=1 Tax=Brucepastera parasyntrophica TaxID=2880008 RepID=UPI00210C554A|nr:DUF1538 family protein [Brucepastera parasyntrophica]